jgi:hypothetical protein
MGGVSSIVRPAGKVLGRRRPVRRRRGAVAVVRVASSELDVLDDKLAPLIEQMMARDDEQEIVLLLQRIEELRTTAP